MKRPSLQLTAAVALPVTTLLAAGCGGAGHKSTAASHPTSSSPSASASAAASRSAAASKFKLPPQLLEPLSAAQAKKWTPRLQRLPGVFAVFYDTGAKELHVFLKADATRAQRQRIITMIGQAATS